MDRKLSKDEELQRLTRIAAAARSHLSGEAIALKARLDVPARIRGSLKSHPTGWLVGSLVSGLAASLLFRRGSPREPKKHRSFPIAILGLILTMVRPFAKVWATDLLKGYLLGEPFKKPFDFPINRTRTPNPP